MTARDLIIVRLQDKEKSLNDKISQKATAIQQFGQSWPPHVKEDKEAEIEALKEQEHNSNTSKQKFQQMVKRTADHLDEHRRLKRRRLGVGAPVLLDEEDEDFVAKSIEDKATYHGRRHNTVMYVNRRVKKNDLLGIVNHKRQTDGKKLLKSATTVWNRSRPRNTRSIQAKHLGKGLFCTSKPPKAEDKDNESTHYQRAHVKNIKLFLFKDDESTKYSLLHSMDDKAYVRPV
ncbi:RNA-directed DNA polymerase from transposon X-element [Paramuricea clavata]|uniref:RNA-directed DNA polymerase from transposon X-element n=1 Tax=Paramuricea clavata TaxID=317549 RepID=A0A6S7GP17_PARCT|nr:RNA-directed DNA polymerase from transposon X-element [Paramuricea clavata]